MRPSAPILYTYFFIFLGYASDNFHTSLNTAVHTSQPPGTMGIERVTSCAVIMGANRWTGKERQATLAKCSIFISAGPDSWTFQYFQDTEELQLNVSGDPHARRQPAHLAGAG